jgi:hypothetical protein
MNRNCSIYRSLVRQRSLERPKLRWDITQMDYRRISCRGDRTGLKRLTVRPPPPLWTTVMELINIQVRQKPNTF